jgi:hypothetical protein
LSFSSLIFDILYPIHVYKEETTRESETKNRTNAELLGTHRIPRDTDERKTITFILKNRGAM